MNFVEPIRNPDMIKAIERHLKEKNERNYILFLIGIYCGLRISDILQLRVSSVQGNTIRLREQKTGKQRKIVIHKNLKGPLNDFIKGKPPEEFIIKSRQGFNKPISRDMAYKILRDLTDYFELESIGTHSMRKTFGYHYYKGTKDVATLQKIFNHSSEAITLKYIGITQDSIDEAMTNFEFVY
ncbi:site-specific integrase [Macrococcoides caseolyticum]|uniref:site-specific integrase n=1 Tax=Macrococcoides TaxID=3076173 RepID=UPI000C34A5BE|nr:MULTISPECIES: site-specific integrase [Macrococcus]PKE07322.1 site-specific integrase [Macrococcus caseolyticus]PKE54063.1 site-specific integrase [Macrococcus caseolyticus]PKF39146.1 site-specific integrase [Macrococcus caseolyticus]TDM21823.1 site-specific integrase [Macrococcus canis]